MSTIAVTLSEIAADGQATRGNDRSSIATRKIIVEKTRIYAAVGNAAILKPLADWYAAGRNPDATPVCDPEDDWTLIVIDRADGMVIIENSSPYPIPLVPPYAIGSGRDFAMGAMLAGASARQAVEIACARDIYSGGAIQSVDLVAAFSRKTTSVIDKFTGKRKIRLEDAAA